MNGTGGSPACDLGGVNGILLLDKPAGISSNKALQIARRALGAAKAGHTGNLDVAATGLLPLCFGQATKVCGFLLEADKRYLAEVQLGVRSTTGDAEGDLTPTGVPPPRADAEILSALAPFVGEIAQVPPMHSALKHRGQPLYRLARQGVEIPRGARNVTIYALELVGREGAVLSLDVRCSKGTYIRTLAEDVGKRLGCGAYLAGLRRLEAGRFKLADALTLDTVVALAEAGRATEIPLIAADAALDALPAVSLSAEAVRRFRQGQPQALARPALTGMVRVYAQDGGFVGVGITGADASLRAKRVFDPLTD